MQNYDDLTLASGFSGHLENRGNLQVVGPVDVETLRTFGTTMNIAAPLVAGGQTRIDGSVTVTLMPSNSENQLDLRVNGVLSDGDLNISLGSLTINIATLGAISAGFERQIFGANTSNVGFWTDDYAVTGAQSTSFAYVLTATEFQSKTDGVSFRVLNSSSTGGHAILDEGAATRAISALVDSDTGRGGYLGGMGSSTPSRFHGVDEIRGGAGDDYIQVTSGTKGLVFAGNGGADILRGGAGRDVLQGSSGNDGLVGGAGNDTLQGDSGNDSITGGAGDDSITGGAGKDTLIGGTGNDIYIADNTDHIIEDAVGGGTDTVFSATSFALGSNLENLTLTSTSALTGTSAINGTGNTLANTITGNGAANTLNGGGGRDTLTGGAGNDTYIADSSDKIIETSTGGIDTVQSAVTLTLAANLEKLVLTGTKAINGTGNTLANTITGNAAANVLNGGTGNDSLTGAKGNDVLIGGAGADDFVFKSGDGRDRITDFVAKGSNSDDLDFRAHSTIVSFADLKANHMKAVGANVVITSGSDTITLVGVKISDLDASDFLF